MRLVLSTARFAIVVGFVGLVALHLASLDGSNLPDGIVPVQEVEPEPAVEPEAETEPDVEPEVEVETEQSEPETELEAEVETTSDVQQTQPSQRQPPPWDSRGSVVIGHFTYSDAEYTVSIDYLVHPMGNTRRMFTVRGPAEGDEEVGEVIFQFNAHATSPREQIEESFTGVDLQFKITPGERIGNIGFYAVIDRIDVQHDGEDIFTYSWPEYLAVEDFAWQGFLCRFEHDDCIFTARLETISRVGAVRFVVYNETRGVAIFRQLDTRVQGSIETGETRPGARYSIRTTHVERDGAWALIGFTLEDEDGEEITQWEEEEDSEESDSDSDSEGSEPRESTDE